jgi:hypothetical protein
MVPPARSRPCLDSRLSWLLLACVALSAGPAAVRAATPRDELLRFVPENTGFCFIFQGLRAHWDALQASTLAEQFDRALGREDREKLDKVQKTVLEPLGLDWAKLRDDVLGEALVIAYRPGPPGQPQKDQGLLLLRVQNEKTLADLVQRFNASQRKKEPPAEPEERRYKGVTYYRHADKKGWVYYHVRGPILLLTSAEEMLQGALDRERSLAPDAPSPLVARLRQLGIDGALLTFWFNSPREFDAVVKAGGARANPATQAAQAAALRYWQAVDDLALAVALDREVSVKLAVRARLAALPRPMQDFLTKAARPSDLWRYFPDNALLAVAGRFSGKDLLAALNDFLPPGAAGALYAELNSKLGAPLGRRNFVNDVLQYLGPDFGFCLTAPGAQDKGPFPQLLGALWVGAGKAEPPLDRTMLSAVQFLAQLAQFTHNTQNPDRPINLVQLGQQEIFYFAGDNVFPPGVQPAFSLRSHYLLLASTPDAIRRFGPPATGIDPKGPVPLLRVSVVAWRAYLKDRREDILQALTAKNELTREEAAKRLDRLQAGLRFLDRVELRQQTGRDQVLLTLAVVPAQPLRKPNP